MLDLTHAIELGAGNERRCYQHPLDPESCVKVARSEGGKRRQNRQEFLYFETLIARNVPFDHLPAYRGKVDTSQGPGMVYERICHDDGTPAQDLEHHIRHGTVSERQARKLLQELYRYLMRYGIAVSDLNPDQLMLKKSASGDRLIIIDGVGARRPGFKAWLMRRVLCYARRKTRKNWMRIQEVYGLRPEDNPSQE
jgi:hypothetical protein